MPHLPRHTAPLLAASLLLTAGVAHANLLTVNPGFEEGSPFFRDTPKNAAGTGPVGWRTNLFGAGSFIGVANDQPTSEGDNFFYIVNDAIAFTDAAARAEVMVGETYTLTFDARDSSAGGNGFSAGLRFFDDAGNPLGGSDEAFIQGV